MNKAPAPDGTTGSVARLPTQPKNPETVIQLADHEQPGRYHGSNGEWWPTHEASHIRLNNGKLKHLEYYIERRVRRESHDTMKSIAEAVRDVLGDLRKGLQEQIDDLKTDPAHQTAIEAAQVIALTRLREIEDSLDALSSESLENGIGAESYAKSFRDALAALAGEYHFVKSLPAFVSIKRVNGSTLERGRASRKQSLLMLYVQAVERIIGEIGGTIYEHDDVDRKQIPITTLGLQLIDKALRLRFLGLGLAGDLTWGDARTLRLRSLLNEVKALGVLDRTDVLAAETSMHTMSQTLIAAADAWDRQAKVIGVMAHADAVAAHKTQSDATIPPNDEGTAVREGYNAAAARYEEKMPYRLSLLYGKS
ncbi:hypothetical protein FHS21_002810 [Phyllobacterium trifolii]|uniref:Uncharacterized protein n=1 Tax=Phyllobacterium trifolii TaxID=300193 RepID=A0A839U8U0_9HYPH|nr:hypothetical protein [Phyllobacterium trifolii]MBB3146395.1 hypothetical protein [Phyllobacterium trifolii]